MNLPALYTQVVAARPEAAVLLDAPPSETDWWWDIKESVAISPRTAEALIGWHWLSLLPDMTSLERSGRRWAVLTERLSSGQYEPTPIEALAAYLLATAKEAT